MVTRRIYVGGVPYIEYTDGRRYPAADYSFKSTDEKPVDGVRNGEYGLEIDTAKVYTFDEEGKTWGNPI